MKKLLKLIGYKSREEIYNNLSQLNPYKFTSKEMSSTLPFCPEFIGKFVCDQCVRDGHFDKFKENGEIFYKLIDNSEEN